MKRPSHFIALLLMALVSVMALGQNARADYRVVPLPGSINGIKSADFKLNEQCLINYPTGNRDMERNAMMLSQYVEELTGIHLSTRPSVNTKDNTGNITLLLDPKMVNDESYSILVTARGVEISGKTPAGVFQGIQTLRKSLPVGNIASVSLPAAQVTAEPRFGYRGMHLDCVRHFFGVETIPHGSGHRSRVRAASLSARYCCPRSPQHSQTAAHFPASLRINMPSGCGESRDRDSGGSGT